MWIPQSRLHKLKIAVHLLQAIITFITGCMTLAILTEKGTHHGRVQWCFALVRLRCADHLLEQLILTTSQCFLTMPALMYQVSPLMLLVLVTLLTVSSA
jgi:uncharacterized membrane protein YoaK (UPF0700 family)